MSRLDPSRAVAIGTVDDFDRWLATHGASQQQLVIAIYKKASNQTVSFDELLEAGFCYGWVDTQTKSIDDERYAIRFVPRPGRTGRRKTARLFVAC